MIKHVLASAVVGVCLLYPASAPAAAPLLLHVDASDAARQVWHAGLTVPVDRPGPLTLVYPKWIPGNHGPTGPIANLASLRASAAGTEVRWTRDPNDVYAFRFAVPSGATSLDVRYDFYEGGTPANVTGQLGVLDWNAVLLYPQGVRVHDTAVQADIALPPGWTGATALPRAGAAPFTSLRGNVRFAPVSLETLVDSPLYCGAHERIFPLLDRDGFTSEVDAFAESDGDLDATPAQVRRWKNLVAEADALYGARHWRHYHFLLTLSDGEAGRGLEHHESSANGLTERYLVDPDAYAAGADLLPHEYTHSWNGKYRRPVGLLTPDFQAPMVDDLLWVYEGMTQYWGYVLAARSGLSERGAFIESIAESFAQLDLEPGRQTRPLLDTARAQALTRAAQSPAGRFARRGEDYYTEGALMWLDADTLIRERTHDKRSLDDVARLFFGAGGTTPPMVLGYTRADVIAALDAVYPFDWTTFLRGRVDAVTTHPPAGGIARGGYRLVFSRERTPAQQRRERVNRSLEALYSLGSTIANDGTVPFTVETLPLARAGVPPGAKILAVNNAAFSTERLRIALDAATKTTAPIALIVDDLGVISTHVVDYHGGQRYPRLVRDRARPDRLTAIAAPKTKGLP